MKVKEWGEKMNREEWRRIVQQTTAHPELLRRKEGRKKGNLDGYTLLSTFTVNAITLRPARLYN
jgi:hypothetical protein